jgi:hypothetical protein
METLLPPVRVAAHEVLAPASEGRVFRVYERGRMAKKTSTGRFPVGSKVRVKAGVMSPEF